MWPVSPQKRKEKKKKKKSKSMWPTKADWHLAVLFEIVDKH